MNQLTQVQTDYQKIQNDIQGSWGNQIALKTLENLVASREESISRRYLNEKQLEKVIAETAETYAKTNNLNVSSSHLALT